MKTRILTALAAIGLLAGCGSRQQTKWEYQEADWFNDDYTSLEVTMPGAAGDQAQQFTFHSAGDFLDAMGSQGWQLVSVVPSHDGKVFYFKRPAGSSHHAQYVFMPHFEKATNGTASAGAEK